MKKKTEQENNRYDFLIVHAMVWHMVNVCALRLETNGRLVEN